MYIHNKYGAADTHTLCTDTAAQAPLSCPQTACRWAPRTRSDEGFDSGTGCDLHVLRVQPPEENQQPHSLSLDGTLSVPCLGGPSMCVRPGHPCPDRRPSVSPAQYRFDEVLVCNLLFRGATVVYRVVGRHAAVCTPARLGAACTCACACACALCAYCLCSSRLVSYKPRPAGPGLALAHIAVNPSFHWDPASFVHCLPLAGTFRCTRYPEV